MARPQNKALPSMLVNAARSFIETRGGPDFSLRELAASVGYTMSAVYRCFDSRDALLQAVQRDLFAAFNAYCAPDLNQTPTQALNDIGRRYLTWAIAHPAWYAFMFESGTELEDPADIAAAQGGFRSLSALLQATDWAGRFDLEDLSVVFLSLMHGLAILSLKGRLRGTRGEDALAFYLERFSVLAGALVGEASAVE